MKFDLRWYQTKALETVFESFRAKKTCLLKLPTGAGKTVIAGSALARAFEMKPEARILVLLNKIELLDQTAKFLRKVLPVSVSEVCGSMGRNDYSGSVVVASIQTISTKKNIEMPHFNIVWVDEAHNCDFEKGAYAELLERIDHDRLKILATTATPWRHDGPIYGGDRIFDKIDYEVTMRLLIDEGFLVKPVCKRSEEAFETGALRVSMGDFNQSDLDVLAKSNKTIKQVEDALPKLQGRNKVVWACINIDHAERVTAELMARGESCVMIHSKQDHQTRKFSMRDFKEGAVRHLAFVAIVSEGFDYPPTDAVCFLRPTKSPVRYVQTVGRALRPFGDKKDALILDYGRVVEGLGPVDAPAVPRRRRAGEKKTEIEIPMKFCPACFSYVTVRAKSCPDCGYEYPIVENLTKASFEGDMLSGDEEKTFKASSPTLSIYFSKSGAPCVKVDYAYGLSEYFVFENNWSKSRLERRLRHMGLKIFETIAETAGQKVEGYFDVTYKKDGRFNKIISVKRSENSGEGQDKAILRFA